MYFNILRAGETFFANAKLLASCNLNKAYLAGSILQVGAVYWQRSANEKNTKTQPLTYLLIGWNIFGALWTSGKLVQALQKKYQLNLICPQMLTGNWATPRWSYTRMFFFNLTFIAASGGAIVGAFAANSIGRELILNKKPKNRVHDVIQTLQLVQVVQNCALALLAVSSVQSCINAATTGASYYTMATVKKYHGEHGGESLREMIPYACIALAGLHFAIAQAQKFYPEHAGTLYQYQLVLTTLDVAAVAGKAYDYDAKNYGSCNRWKSEYVGFGALCSIIALAWIIYTHRAEGNTNLVDMLKESLPEADLSSLEINHKAPWGYRWIQWMLLNKVILDLFLAPAHKPDSKLHFASAAFTALTFLQILDLEFIHFKRTYQNPLANRNFKLFDLSYAVRPENVHAHFQNTLTTASLNFHFIQPGDSLPLDQTVKAIYDYSEAFFDDSHWMYYWIEHYHRGVKIGESFHMKAQIVMRDILVGGKNFDHNLVSWGSHAYQRWNGAAGVQLEPLLRDVL